MVCDYNKKKVGRYVLEEEKRGRGQRVSGTVRQGRKTNTNGTKKNPEVKQKKKKEERPSEKEPGVE